LWTIFKYNEERPNQKEMGDGSVAGGPMARFVPYIPVVAGMVLLIAVPWEWKARLLIGGISILLLHWGIRYDRKRFSQEAKIRESEKVLRLLSLQRHDWMNHIQVFMGYISMGKQERMMPYLKRLTEGLHREREASQIPYPPLALLLSTIQQQVPEWHWQVQLKSPDHISSPQEGEQIRCLICYLLDFIKEQAQEEPATLRLNLRFEKGSGYLQLEADESVWSRLCFDGEDWDRLQQILQKEGCQWDLLGNGLAVRILFNVSRSSG
jgi:hypothetical protein